MKTGGLLRVFVGVKTSIFFGLELMENVKKQVFEVEFLVDSCKMLVFPGSFFVFV